jgi:hypothetical protein
MGTFGFAGFALGFMAIIWWLTRLMGATGRNDENRTGGGGSAGF